MGKSDLSRDRGISIHLFNKLEGNTSGDGGYYAIYIKQIMRSDNCLVVDLGNININARMERKSKVFSMLMNLPRGAASTAKRVRHFIEIAVNCRSLISILYLWKVFVMEMSKDRVAESNREAVLLVIQHWYLVAAGEYLERLYCRNRCFKVCVLHVADHEALEETYLLNKKLKILDNRQKFTLGVKRLGMKMDCESSCRRVDRVTCFSENDVYRLRHAGIHNVSVTDISGGLRVATEEEFQSRCYLRERLKKTLATREYMDLRFVGDLRWYPNLLALADLEQLRRLIESQLGIGCSVNVAGKFNSRVEDRFPTIKFHGFVNDLVEFLELGDIFMNLVRIGGGIRTKNIAALENSSLPLFLHSRYRGEVRCNQRINYFNDTLEIVGKISAALNLESSEWSLYQDRWI